MKRKALKRCLGMTLSLVLSVTTVFSGVTPAFADEAETVAVESVEAENVAEAEKTEETAGEVISDEVSEAADTEAVAESAQDTTTDQPENAVEQEATQDDMELE